MIYYSNQVRFAYPTPSPPPPPTFPLTVIPPVLRPNLLPVSLLPRLNQGRHRTRLIHRHRHRRPYLIRTHHPVPIYSRESQKVWTMASRSRCRGFAVNIKHTAVDPNK